MAKKRKTVAIEGNEDLVRDIDSKAIVSQNSSALLAAKLRKKAALDAIKHKDETAAAIQELSDRVATLEALVQTLVPSKNK